MMRLFHVATSPYVRKVMVALHETGQLGRVELLSVDRVDAVTPNPELLVANPVKKLPALLLKDGSVLHDSRVILDYLDSLHNGTPLIPHSGMQRWQQLTLASSADAVMDAAILVRNENFLRPPEKRWVDWSQAQMGKVEQALAWWESQAHTWRTKEFAAVGPIGVACALGYVDLRLEDYDWRADAPKLADWFAAVSERVSMRNTAPNT